MSFRYKPQPRIPAPSTPSGQQGLLPRQVAQQNDSPMREPTPEPATRQQQPLLIHHRLKTQQPELTQPPTQETLPTTESTQNSNSPIPDDATHRVSVIRTFIPASGLVNNTSPTSNIQSGSGREGSHDSQIDTHQPIDNPGSTTNPVNVSAHSESSTNEDIIVIKSRIELMRLGLERLREERKMKREQPPVPATNSSTTSNPAPSTTTADIGDNATQQESPVSPRSFIRGELRTLLSDGEAGFLPSSLSKQLTTSTERQAIQQPPSSPVPLHKPQPQPPPQPQQPQHTPFENKRATEAVKGTILEKRTQGQRVGTVSGAATLPSRVNINRPVQDEKSASLDSPLKASGPSALFYSVLLEFKPTGSGEGNFASDTADCIVDCLKSFFARGELRRSIIRSIELFQAANRNFLNVRNSLSLSNSQSLSTSSKSPSTPKFSTFRNKKLPPVPDSRGKRITIGSSKPNSDTESGGGVSEQDKAKKQEEDEQQIQEDEAREKERIIEKKKRKRLVKLLKVYKLQSFSRRQEAAMLDKILQFSLSASSVRHDSYVRDVIKEMMAWMLTSWGIDKGTAASWVSDTITKRYDEVWKKTVMAKTFLTGIGKKVLPFWRVTVVVIGIVTYCALKDVYLQFVDNYFLERKSTVTRLINPDYYARLGGSCFYTLLTLLRKSNDDIKNLLLFILEWEFGKDQLGVNPETNANAANPANQNRKRKKTNAAGESQGQTEGAEGLKKSGGDIHVNNINMGEGWVYVEGASGGVSGGNGGSGIGSAREAPSSWVMDELVSKWVANFNSDKNEMNEAKYLIISEEGIVRRGRKKAEVAVIPKVMSIISEPIVSAGDSVFGESSVFSLADKLRGQQERKLWVQYFQEFAKAENFPYNLDKKDRKLRAMVRQYGIPPELRGQFWQGVTPATGHKSLFSYQSVLLNCLNRESKYATQIEKDLRRTFPEHEKFSQVEGEGIAALRRVLTAYSFINTDVGYCQSMNFIAALLLLFLEEEEAFWMLLTLIEDTLPSDFYASGMTGLKIDTTIFLELLELKVPKVKMHMQLLGVNVQAILHHWFLCLFVTVLPLEIVVRVWDIFFFEGNTVFFRVALALFKAAESQILSKRDEADVYVVVKSMPQNIQLNHLMELLFSSHFIGVKKMVKRLRIKEQEEHDRILKGFVPTSPPPSHLPSGGGSVIIRRPSAMMKPRENTVATPPSQQHSLTERVRKGSVGVDDTSFFRIKPKTTDDAPSTTTTTTTTTPTTYGESSASPSSSFLHTPSFISGQTIQSLKRSPKRLWNTLRAGPQPDEEQNNRVKEAEDCQRVSLAQLQRWKREQQEREAILQMYATEEELEKEKGKEKEQEKEKEKEKEREKEEKKEGQEEEGDGNDGNDGNEEEAQMLASVNPRFQRTRYRLSLAISGDTRRNRTTLQTHY